LGTGDPNFDKQSISLVNQVRALVIWSLAVAGLHGLAACTSPPEVTAALENHGGDLEARLDTVAPWLLKSHRVPGASIAVVRRGDVVVAKGWGVTREGGDPIDADTVFEAASLSKPLFAYAVMKLVRDGRLDLDKPLADYLGRRYVTDDHRVLRVTARHVLSHTGGFPNWRPRHWTKNPDPLKMIFEPGERFRYSAEGFGYLQAAVEKLTGESLEVFMQRSVLKPLEMSRTTYVWTPARNGAYAIPHGMFGQAKPKQVRTAHAAASLHTTAADLGQFLSAMLGQVPTDRRDVTLDSIWISRMLKPQVDVAGQFAWALGWGLERGSDGTVFWQWGDNGTFQHFVAGSRESGTAVAVLTNGWHGVRVYRPIVKMVMGHDLDALVSPFLPY